MKNQKAVFEKVRDIIAAESGADPRAITMETDLCGDLGIAGDDGDDVLRAISRQFDVDWSKFDSGVHFGDEACTLPMPWRLKGSHWLYRTQPCRVEDIVRAVQDGEWSPVPLEPQRGMLLGLVYFGSYFQAGLLLLIMAAMLAGIVSIYLGWS